jgi:hypothetical protein
MRVLPYTVVLTTACLFISATSATAAGYPSCVKKWRKDKRACVEDCFKDKKAVEASRGLDPSCVQSCQKQQSAWLENTIASIDGCLVSCDQQDEAGRTACPLTNAEARKICLKVMDDHLTRCRASCRPEDNIRDLVNACRVSLRACLQECPKKKN